MSDVQDLESKPRVHVWRRVFVGLGVLILLIIVGGFFGSQWDRSRVQSERAKLEAHLDETDPKWRLTDLLEAREQVPDAENSALVVVLVSKMLPRTWPPQNTWDKFNDLQSPVQLNGDQSQLLEGVMPPVAPAVAQARRIADMPRGRHRFDVQFNPIATLLPDQQESRKVASLLNHDALLLIHKGDIDGALRSCRGIINTGRSLGDEPLLISQLIRIACVAIGCNAAERALGHGRASEGELVKLQRLLDLEQKHQTMTLATRGERAMSYDIVTKIVDGRIRPGDLRDMVGGERGNWWEHLFGVRVSRRDPVHNLRLMTKAVEATRLPEGEEMIAAERAYEAETMRLGRDALLTKMLTPAVSKVGQACRRKSAQVRSLMVAVAVERYRMKHDRWPDSLAALKPEFLEEIPLDPFDGKPLRYAKLPDGVTVYSVGQDGTDNGGNINRNKPQESGFDQGFRLWDVKSRRRMPPEREAELDPDG